MKKLILLFSLIIFTGILTSGTLMAQIAQNIKLYCMGGTSEPTFYKLDAFSATATAINTINEVYGKVQGSSTFDHSCNHYIFSGVDTNQIKRLYTIDTLGNILSNSVMSTLSINALQYDMKNNITYGFVGDTSTMTCYLGEINTNNADINLITELDVMGIQKGGVTFDSNTGIYIFIGPGPGGADDNRLICVNAQNGTIESNILINDISIGSLQFDNNFNKLYGIYRDTAILVPKYFAEIDPFTADITILDTLHDLYGTVSGSQDFDQATGTFIFAGDDTSQVRKLYMINASTGQIISDSPISEGLGDLECDNTHFAKNFYTSVKESETALDNLSVFPNPNKGTFQLGFSVEMPQNVSIKVVNNLGQVVYEEVHKNYNGSYSKEIDISSLANGVYMLNIKVGGNVYTENISVLR